VQAFILAAGKGTRLLPYTKYLPKPLFPIVGIPIIEIIFKQLIKIGIKKFGVNTYHLKDKLIDFLNKLQKKYSEIEINIFEEPKLLGTGGAFLNAKSFFSSPTLIINADTITNINFLKVLNYHFKNPYPITMVFYKGDNNNVEINISKGIVKNFRVNKNNNLFTYTGIQVINPDILKKFSFKEDLIEIYQEFLNKNINIGAYIIDNIYFKDIGTIENYLKVHKDILTNKVNIPEIKLSKEPFIIKTKYIGKNVKFRNWVYIEEDTFIQDNTVLCEVVTWRGARVLSGYYEKTLLI